MVSSRSLLKLLGTIPSVYAGDGDKRALLRTEIAERRVLDCSAGLSLDTGEVVRVVLETGGGGFRECDVRSDSSFLRFAGFRAVSDWTLSMVSEVCWASGVRGRFNDT